MFYSVFIFSPFLSLSPWPFCPLAPFSLILPFWQVFAKALLSEQVPLFYFLSEISLLWTLGSQACRYHPCHISRHGRHEIRHDKLFHGITQSCLIVKKGIELIFWNLVNNWATAFESFLLIEALILHEFKISPWKQYLLFYYWQAQMLSSTWTPFCRYSRHSSYQTVC